MACYKAIIHQPNGEECTFWHDEHYLPAFIGQRLEADDCLLLIDPLPGPQRGNGPGPFFALPEGDGPLRKFCNRIIVPKAAVIRITFTTEEWHGR